MQICYFRIGRIYTEEEIKNMPASKAQQKAVSKYMKENYDELKARVPKGQKEIIRAHAETVDGSLNKFLNRAINETMERDNKKAGE